MEKTLPCLAFAKFSENVFSAPTEFRQLRSSYRFNLKDWLLLLIYFDPFFLSVDNEILISYHSF